MKEYKTEAVTYGDSTSFFIDPVNKTAVPVWQSAKDYNKGWVNVHVGEHTTKARNRDSDAAMRELLAKYYPSNRVKQSFYNDLSYHSGINQGNAGKVDNYGIGEPYMVQFSRYTPVGSYKLLYPVKTSGMGDFGKVRTKVTAYDWEYIVNNWIPQGSGKKKWQVKHTIKHADGTEDVIYQSPEMDDPERALELFNKQVTDVGGKAYRVPENLDEVFSKEWDRMDKAREGKIKIRRTTGRRRATTHIPTSLRRVRG